jgi:5-methylcytosine-specific restriction endonuclease McrA
MPKGVYKRTERHIPWNKGLKGFRAGVRHSEETRDKIRQKALGRKHSQETKKKLSKYFSGRPIREDVRLKIKATMKAKFKGPPVNEDLRRSITRMRRSKEYIDWRNEVLCRDGYACLWCGESNRNKLTVDHIVPISKSFGLALDPDNGRVLCSLCHISVSTHGRGSWSEESKEKMLAVYKNEKG